MCAPVGTIHRQTWPIMAYYVADAMRLDRNLKYSAVDATGSSVLALNGCFVIQPDMIAADAGGACADYALPTPEVNPLELVSDSSRSVALGLCVYVCVTRSVSPAVVRT